MAIRRLSTLIQIGGAVASTLGSALRQVRQGLGGIGSAINSLESLQRRLNDRIGAYIRAGRDITNMARAYGAVRRAAEDLTRIQARLNRAQQQFSDNASRTSQLRGQIVEAAGLATALAAPVYVAASFEQAMARVGAVSRASAGDLDRLTAEARRLGAATEWSASDAASGMSYLAMAGFNVEQIMGTMPGMLDLATAAQIDLGRAADISSNILTAFGLQASDMTMVSDTLVSTFTSSNVTLEMLGDTMRYLGPVAAATGVDLQEAAAMTGLLGNAGIQASQAGTSLRQMIARLASPMSRGAQQLERIGVSTRDSAGNLRPLADIFQDMSRGMEGMGTADRSEVLRWIFGLESLAAATVLVDQAGSGALQDYTGRVYEAGSAARVAGQQADTTIGGWKRLQSAIEENAIVIGNQLLPVVRDILDDLAAVGMRVSAWAEANPELTRTIVYVTSALVALAVTAFVVQYAWAIMVGVLLWAKIVFLNLVYVIRLVTLTFQLMSAFGMINPVVLAVVALAVAAALLYIYWEPIKAWWLGLWSDVQYIAFFAWEAIKEWLGWDPIEAFRPYWEPVLLFFQNVWYSITTVIVGYWEAIKGYIGAWIPLEMISAAWLPVQMFFQNMWYAIYETFREYFGWISEGITGMGNQISWLLGMGDQTTSGVEGDVRVDQNGDPIVPGGGGAPTGVPGAAMPSLPNLGAAVAPPAAAPTAPAIPLPADFANGGAMPDLSALGAPRPATTNNIQMNVTQQPFESGEAFADSVARRVMQQLQSQQAGALFDGAAG